MMKRVLAILLCCVIVFSSSVALVSCNQPDENEDKKLSFEIEGATNGIVAFSNEIVLKVLVRNNDPSITYAMVEIDGYGKKIENANEKGILEIEIDDFNSEKYSDWAGEELVLKFDKRPSGAGYSYGTFEINLYLYEGKDAEKEKGREYIYVAYVMDSENIAFSLGDCEYRQIYEKLPKAKYRTRASYLWPLNSYPMEHDGGLGAVCIDTEIEGTGKRLIGEPFNINVGVASRYPVNNYTGVLTVDAKGFSIVNENGDTSKDGFSQSYEHFVSGDYPYEMQYDSVYESKNVIGDTYGKWEKLYLLCDDKSEDSGEIVFVLEADFPASIPGGHKATKTVYYAKDGEYIVYSLVSVDAAKRALYSELGYFFKVSVPEYFDSLFA